MAAVTRAPAAVERGLLHAADRQQRAALRRPRGRDGRRPVGDADGHRPRRPARPALRADLRPSPGRSGLMFEFLAGASFIAAAAIALFFARFWRDTGDRFFALFA